MERPDAALLGKRGSPRRDTDPVDGAGERSGAALAGVCVLSPAISGIRVCYGQAQQSGPTSVSTLTPVAKITGDWSAFLDKAKAIMFEGAKTMTIRRKET